MSDKLKKLQKAKERVGVAERQFHASALAAFPPGSIVCYRHGSRYSEAVVVRVHDLWTVHGVNLDVFVCGLSSGKEYRVDVNRIMDVRIPRPGEEL